MQSIVDRRRWSMVDVGRFNAQERAPLSLPSQALFFSLSLSISVSKEIDIQRCRP